MEGFAFILILAVIGCLELSIQVGGDEPREVNRKFWQPECDPLPEPPRPTLARKAGQVE